MGSLQSDLAAVADEVRETHISWVFLIGAAAYKVKKPVSFGFLDFSTLEQRRLACEAEVRLNARLAPDVYEGVVPIVRSEGGRHQVGGAGFVVDYAVRMRRLSDDIRADSRLRRNDLEVADVDRIAKKVARFHEAQRSDERTARFGTPEAIARNVRGNFAETRELFASLVDVEETRAIERWQNAFLDRHAARFRARIDAGRVRDGHGDLRLEHIYFERDRVLIIDCIEFADRFRYADVCADIAFLAMDLGWHGRVDLAERFLATYARETSDYELYGLVDFYESYRACVRAKVEALLTTDSGAPFQLRERAAKRVHRYFRLARAAEREPLVPPVLVAVGGWLASGKSTLADRLSALMGAPAINTDRIRKHILGARPTERLDERAFRGAYDPSVTEAVYRRVLTSAEKVLASGRSVIVDGTFRSRVRRHEARELAGRCGVDFLFVECLCEPELCRARLRKREQEESVSDGRLAIFDEFVASWEPVTELSPSEHLRLDTSQPIEANLATLRERVPMWTRAPA